MGIHESAPAMEETIVMKPATRKAIDSVLRAIRRAKDKLTGRAYKAAHEAESKLMVARGDLKSTYKRKQEPRKRRKAAKKDENKE